jgi:hypothetical protein
MTDASWQTYREELARNAFSGDSTLRFFIRWLEHRDGYEWDGQWFPSNGIDLARCLQLVRDLSVEQIRDLYWRMIIQPPREERHLFTLDLSFNVIDGIEGQAVVVLCMQRKEVLYDLIADNMLIRLRPGEQELLVAAGFPGTIDEVLTILWRRIAPAAPAEQDEPASDASPR